MSYFKGKTVIVTGASSGIGEATAKEFLLQGAKVILVARSESKMYDSFKDFNQDSFSIYPFDLTNLDDIDSFVKMLIEKEGPIDILFNNAGIAEGGFFEDQPYENHLRVININLFGVINGIYSAIELLKNTENSLCLNTSSSTGIIGLPMTSVYSASKHAVKGLTESLSAEFKRFGIKVSDILPGVIDTPLISKDIRSTLPADGMWRLIPAEEIAKTVYRAYEEDKIHWYVPEDLEDLEKLVVEDPVKARDEVISTGPMKIPLD